MSAILWFMLFGAILFQTEGEHDTIGNLTKLILGRTIRLPEEYILERLIDFEHRLTKIRATKRRNNFSSHFIDDANRKKNYQYLMVLKLVATP